MRIYILFSDDPIFKPRLLHQILLQGNHDICGVGEVSAPRRGGIISKIKFNFRFWGLWPFICIAWSHYYRKLLSLLPISPSINGRSSMQRVCKSYKIPYRQVRRVNADDFLGYLRKINPDVILSFQHQIFREKIISIPRIACINCHPALLPAYRGVKPIFWAMINREKYFGVTVHTMTAEIDRGNIVSQAKIPLHSEHTMFQNYIAAYELSAYVILDALLKLEKSSDAKLGIPIESSAYYSEPTDTDLKRFREMGLRMF